MLGRRSFLALLGLGPVVVPLALEAPAAPMDVFAGADIQADGILVLARAGVVTPADAWATFARECSLFLVPDADSQDGFRLIRRKVTANDFAEPDSSTGKAA